MECPDAPAERPRPALGQALSRSLVALDQDSTIIAVVEMCQSRWLVAGMFPGIGRQARKTLERGFLGCLGGEERGHCTMARIPTIAEEDAKRPNRERECLVGNARASS